MTGILRQAGVALLLLGACADPVDDTSDPVPCACFDGVCDEAVCDVGFTLPESCQTQFSTAQVFVGSTSAGTAVPGEAFTSCTVTVPAGGTSQVRVDAQDFNAPLVEAYCDLGGQSTEPVVCSLKFELSESCVGLPGRETAIVAVDGVEYGETTLDSPFVPCLWLAPGDNVTGTIRSGSDLVVSVPLSCTAQGGEVRFVFECPR